MPYADRFDRESQKRLRLCSTVKISESVYKMQTHEASLIRVEIERGEKGLFYATSPDLRGLLVAKPTVEALESYIPQAIEELHSVKGEDVLVVKIANQDVSHLWVVLPISVAAEGLERAQRANPH
jgi:hypothetical protein